MKGNSKGSGSPVYAGKSQGSLYTNKGKTMMSYSLGNKTLSGYNNTGDLGYLPPANMIQQYMPTIPQGYSNDISSNQKTGYLEMLAPNLMPMKKQDNFNPCEDCRIPVLKPSTKCIGCALGNRKV